MIPEPVPIFAAWMLFALVVGGALVILIEDHRTARRRERREAAAAAAEVLEPELTPEPDDDLWPEITDPGRMPPLGPDGAGVGSGTADLDHLPGGMAFGDNGDVADQLRIPPGPITGPLNDREPCRDGDYDGRPW